VIGGPKLCVFITAVPIIKLDPLLPFVGIESSKISMKADLLGCDWRSQRQSSEGTGINIH